MAIYCIDGKPRHGKTAWMMFQAQSALKEFARIKDGSKVFCNVALMNWGKGLLKGFNESIIGDILNPKDLENPDKILFYWRNIHEWNVMKKGIIFCDEGARYFNARNWQNLHPDTEVKLQQHGKEDLDVWVDIQHYTRIDTAVRVLVEEFYRVERVFGWGNKTFVARVTSHQLEDLDKYEKMILDPEAHPELEQYFKEYFFISGRVKRLYDTKAKVAESRPMPLRHEVRFCLDPNCKYFKDGHVSHA